MRTVVGDAAFGVAVGPGGAVGATGEGSVRVGMGAGCCATDGAAHPTRMNITMTRIRSCTISTLTHKYELPNFRQHVPTIESKQTQAEGIQTRAALRSKWISKLLDTSIQANEHSLTNMCYFQDARPEQGEQQGKERPWYTAGNTTD